MKHETHSYTIGLDRRDELLAAARRIGLFATRLAVTEFMMTGTESQHDQFEDFLFSK